MHTPGAAPVILSDLWPEQAASCCIEKQTLDVIARTGREGKGRSMEKLDALLDFIEGHIDEEHIRRTERLHLDAMAYLSVPHLPLAMVFPPVPPEIPVPQIMRPSVHGDATRPLPAPRRRHLDRGAVPADGQVHPWPTTSACASGDNTQRTSSERGDNAPRRRRSRAPGTPAECSR